MTSGRSVRFLLPADVDDPRRVSGGNVYDRHIRDGLPGHGWVVVAAGIADGGEASSVLDRLPDDMLVLIDGLVAGWAPAAVEAAASRMTVVLLAHMVAAAFPDVTDAAAEAERRAVRAAHRLIVTGRWTAEELVRRRLTDADRITVAAPGVHLPPEPAAPRDPSALLCVGVVAPHKGQDTLLAALAALGDQPWTCTIVGSTQAYPEYAAAVRHAAAALGDRVRFVGALGGEALADAYRRSAVLVAPSRVESAGMAIAEARAHGLPVIGADVGGIPYALAAGGGRVVPAGDATALAGALRDWLTDPALRARLRDEALAAREELPTWADAVLQVARTLEAA
ncbi:glycosyltransferase family 4 protein [Microbacterium timonense]|uniref:glycosyltransferase family 4 protein n=1 Tax=Microbacterium timonense TaxID=2086576 RepID=UPI000D10BC24|nr:glycosyltransferase family 4 protein [Microbacterium timonense]